MLGVISILVSVFCGWFFWKKIKNIISGVDLTEEVTTAQTPDKVEVGKFLEKLDIYISALKMGNIRKLNSIMSDSMYHMTETDAQVLARLGVRRDIEYVTTGFIESVPMMSDGKVSWSTIQIPCRYTERLIDFQTDEVVNTTYYSDATLVMHLTRSDSRQPGEEVSCIGCGQPISTGGELFICQHCGATYTSDSYDWSISGYAVLSEKIEGMGKASAMMMRASIAVMIMMVALPILGFISTAAPFLRFIVIPGNILMAGAVLYWGLKVVPESFRGLNDMRRIDPLFSMQKFFSRVQYLVAVFFNAMNYNYNNLKPFIDPYVYAEIVQNYNPTGNYVLKVDITGDGKTSEVTRHGGKIYMTVTANMFLTVIDSYRRVQKVEKQLAFQVCRAESAMTTLKPNPDVLICPGCDRSINLTADGKCKFCGADYDLSQIDWILGRVDSAMFI